MGADLDRIGRTFYGDARWKQVRRRARIRRAVQVAIPFARLGFYLLGAVSTIVIVVEVLR